MLRKLILFFCTVMLAACGGGSSEASVTSPAPGPAPAPVPSPAPEPVKVNLKPINIDLSSTEIFLQFDPPVLDNLSPVDTIVRKMNGDNISKIPVDYEQSCDDQNNCTMCESVNLNDYEINISDPIQLDNDRHFAFIQFPNEVSKDCEIRYGSGHFIVNSDGSSLELPAETDPLYKIYSPNERGTNFSENSIIAKADLGELFEVIQSDETINLIQINRSGDGAVESLTAYDGKYTLSRSNVDEGWVLYNKNSQEIININPEDSNLDQFNRNDGGIWVDHEGDFIISDATKLIKVNLDGATESKWGYCYDDQKNQCYWSQNLPSYWMNGFRGRHDTWVISRRCQLTNYENGDWRWVSSDGILATPDNINEINTQFDRSPRASKIRNGKAYCANHDKYVFSLYFIDDDEYLALNTDDYNLTVNNFGFSKNVIGFWDYDPNVSATVFQLYSFETKEFKDFGVIELDDGRKALEFIPIN